MYSYAEQRHKLFTEDGVEMLRRVEANAGAMLSESGAFKAVHAWAGCSGDSWTMLACLDYLCEKKVLRRVTDGRSQCAQDEVYVRA